MKIVCNNIPYDGKIQQLIADPICDYAMVISKDDKDPNHGVIVCTSGETSHNHMIYLTEINDRIVGNDSDLVRTQHPNQIKSQVWLTKDFLRSSDMPKKDIRVYQYYDQVYTETLVVNFYGGPGIRKSTMMLELAAKLKRKGIETEIAYENAKLHVYDNSLDLLKDQLTIFAEQYRSINRLLGKVQVIITDSPLLLSHIYGRLNNYNLPDEFYDLVTKCHDNMRNMDILLTRGSSDTYSQVGRVQDANESLNIDESIKCLLNETTEYYYLCNNTSDEVDQLSDWISDCLSHGSHKFKEIR